MTSSAAPRIRVGGMPASGTKGAVSSLRARWPWVLLTLTLVAMLALGWSATRWYPTGCVTAECLAVAPARINAHWVGLGLLWALAVAGAVLTTASRTPAKQTIRARLSPGWHGVVVGVVVMVLATGALLPTVGLGLFSPPLGVGLITTEWVLLAIVLDRMHRAARPASSPRRRLAQSYAVAAGVIGLEVALPLFSPSPALSAGMLLLALLQAGAAVVLTTWFSLIDPADHRDQRSERRIAVAIILVAAVLGVALATIGMDLSRATLGGFGEDLANLLHPY